MAHSMRQKAIAGAIALLLAASSLTACAGPSGTGTTAPPGGGEVTADNPFGLAAGSKIEAVAFDGGYHTDWVNYGGSVLTGKFSDVQVTVKATTKIATEMQPRFVGNTPPDLLNNQGADQIPFTSLEGQLAPLDDLWAATNYDGITVADAVFPGIKESGTYNGQFVAVPYVMTVYALWYSKTLFDANGWTLPKTWDDAKALCTSAKAQGKYLFVFGKEAANYWKWMAVDSAIKEGGLDVIRNLANLKPDAWSQPALKSVMETIADLVKEGCFIPGGEGMQFTSAQAKWSQDQEALLYFSGSWIENEMKEATADNFQMMAAPVPTLTTNSALPYEAIQAGADEKLVVPAKAANLAGGKEMLRALLSKDAAANFSKTRLSPTIVKDTVPADGYGSTALASMMAAMTASGDDLFSWFSGGYEGYYALGSDEVVLWNSFLSGQFTAEQMIQEEQKLADKIAADNSVAKVTYNF